MFSLKLSKHRSSRCIRSKPRITEARNAMAALVIRSFSTRRLRYAVKDKSCYVTWHTSRTYIIAGYLSDNNHITPALPIVIDARPWVRKHLSVNGSRMTQLNAGKAVFSFVLFLLPFLSGTAPFIWARVSMYLAFPGYLVIAVVFTWKSSREPR